MKSSDLDDIIHQTIRQATEKMATSDLVKAVSTAARADAKTVRRAIQTLVNTGELRYTYVYGTSFLEKSFDRPVRISTRIIIKPPEKPYPAKLGEIVIDLAGGAAFGDGSHPSTSLIFKAIDAVFAGCRSSPKAKIPSKALDVGTGSGILAIAMAKLGVRDVTATDIDPCSRTEAGHNAKLNGVSAQVKVSGSSLEALSGSFGLIVANLAGPTLEAMSPLLTKKMALDGILILSGFKKPASIELREIYEKSGLRLIREENHRQWVCLVFRKPIQRPRQPV